MLSNCQWECDVAPARRAFRPSARWDLSLNNLFLLRIRPAKSANEGPAGPSATRKNSASGVARRSGRREPMLGPIELREYRSPMHVDHIAG